MRPFSCVIPTHAEIPLWKANVTEISETTSLEPKFDAHGLLSAIIVDAADNSVLMFAHMNAEAFAKTRATGLVHFWSRSRNALWLKGETSGESFKVTDIRVDCDQDCLLIRVTPEGKGNACHTGRRSCFYRKVEKDGLVFDQS
jgi:phosphoribosyl-AMP cyclohydrolase